jgi:hypothetical protein
MANINFQLSGASLQVIDNTATVQRVNSPIATIVGQVAATFYDPYILIPNPGPVVLTLPGAIIWQVYVRNINATNTISITATPAGGAAWASPLVLAPNSVFLYMATYSANPAAGGITALSLGASGATTFAEVALAA